MGAKERRNREKEMRKKQILDSARTLLFEKGIKSTTINQIAKLAELSVGTIYIYYKRKEEIFAELQEEGLELLEKSILENISVETDCRKKLLNAGKAYIEFSREQSDYFNIINYFLTSPEFFFEGELKNRIDSYAERILAICDRIIESGIEKGVFKTVNSRKYSIFFFSSIHGLLQFRKIQYILDDDGNMEGVSDYILKQLIEGLVVVE